VKKASDRICVNGDVPIRRRHAIIERGKMESLYRKSIFEKNGEFKFLLIEKDDRPTSLCESVESSSIFNMSCTSIQVTRFRNPKGVTEQDYFAQRDRLIQNGWVFRGEAFDELPIAVAN